jgi:hypothetical protein
MKAICARNSSGMTASAANVAASTMPGRGDHAAGDAQADQHGGPRAARERLLADAAGEEDVVVDPERHQEDEGEQRHHRVGAREAEHVLEHQPRDAERGEVREHRGAISSSGATTERSSSISISVITSRTSGMITHRSARAVARVSRSVAVGSADDGERVDGAHRLAQVAHHLDRGVAVGREGERRLQLDQLAPVDLRHERRPAGRRAAEGPACAARPRRRRRRRRPPPPAPRRRRRADHDRGRAGPGREVARLDLLPGDATRWRRGRLGLRHAVGHEARARRPPRPAGRRRRHPHARGRRATRSATRAQKPPVCTTGEARSGVDAAAGTGRRPRGRERQQRRQERERGEHRDGDAGRGHRPERLVRVEVGEQQRQHAGDDGAARGEDRLEGAAPATPHGASTSLASARSASRKRDTSSSA